MYLSATNFDKTELINRIIQYLIDNGVKIPILRKAISDEFNGTNPHACAVDASMAAKAQYLKRTKDSKES